MKRLILKIAAMALFFSPSIFAQSIVDRPEITAFTFGGGGEILKFGDAGVVSGIVVGQSVAQAPTAATASDKSTLEVRHGFWIELSTLKSGSSSIQKSHPSIAGAISAKFLDHAVSIQLQLPHSSSISVRLVDMEGRQTMTPWTGNVNAGTSKLEVPLFTLGSQPLLLIIQAGSLQKTYRFVPELIQ